MNEVLDKYQEAIQYFNQNNFAKAKEFFSELLNENPNDFDALNYVGIIQFTHLENLKKPQVFSASSWKLIHLHPVTLYNLGLSYQYFSDYEKAEDKLLNFTRT